MLSDVVIDTNVFIHAQNPAEKRSLAAKDFLESLLEVTTELCVDGLFNLNSPHLSKIAHEYLTMIPPIGLGYAILVRLLQSGRVKMNVSTNLPPEKRRLVVRLVRDPRDKTFVYVAFNSEDTILTSHDWVDFPERVREIIRKQLLVTIEEASETIARIHE